jgi:hypothetical protein
VRLGPALTFRADDEHSAAPFPILLPSATAVAIIMVVFSDPANWMLALQVTLAEALTPCPPIVGANLSGRLY